MSNSRRIVKNTAFLYIRMFLIIGTTLYSSRIVLQELGVSDYGIYNLVGGFVTMLGFFNAAMSSATQRYLSYDIGKGDFGKLKKTFSATLSIHIGIALLGLILAETVGLWYINSKMVFPHEKIYEVNVVYQFSILTFLLSIVQVPYNALIIARERMNIYAYVSILEALLKLSIVFVLIYVVWNKLIVYSILTFTVAFLIRITYQVYCRREFVESRYRFWYNRQYYMELISYSGWNLFGNIASIAKGQGVNMVLNVFFGTIVNATYGITNQLLSAVNMFVTNFQLAVNPQIVKNYSKGNIKEAHLLISQSSKFSFFLMLLLVAPVLLNTDYILILWLKTPPELTTIFVQLCLINVLIDCLSGSLMIGAQATGNIKWYQIIVGTLVFLNLPISYLVLKLGGEPYSVYFISITISLISLHFRMFFLRKVMGFNVKDYYSRVILKVFLLCFLAGALIYTIRTYSPYDTGFLLFFIESLVTVAVLSMLILSVGITGDERNFVMELIRKKIKK